jgi:hypothetical protein
MSFFLLAIMNLVLISPLAEGEWPWPASFPRLEWFGLALALFGLAHYARQLVQRWSVRWWARTRGRILGVDLRKSRRRQHDGSVVYEPVITYAYHVGERQLEGRRLAIDSHSGALTWGLKMLKTFRPGAEVAVWYHPKQPTEAMLLPVSLRGHAVKLLLCGSLLLTLLWRLLVL